ncbi:hypothetical protein E1B28_003266 [Marasmius oreades]|uniref:Amidohydrolase-related domain-containing protein n=1 Tax=Marasmius oreades TaxID=181124 RepID=A0A9P7RLK1_9AGAR|nr:uncharacterized protein E1B28_003266 [Marasmius oreades]KAG7085722.1 hypothetical protein E1B28_003266 [Marasmius oreades]
MGHGRPICFNDYFRANTCLGGDYQSNGGVGIPGEMKLGLQAERGLRNQKIIDKGLIVRTVYRTGGTIGTIHGARAIGMEEKSIEVGMLADLVVFNADSPSKVCAAQNNPVDTVVLFSTPADVSAVVIDGQVRKLDGKLKNVKVTHDLRELSRRDVLEWKEIAKHLSKRREIYREKIDKVDFEEAKRDWITLRLGTLTSRNGG